MAKTTKDKEAFFKELEQLDYLTSDSEDNENDDISRLMLLSKKADSPHPTDIPGSKALAPIVLTDSGPQSSLGAVGVEPENVSAVAVSEDPQKPVAGNSKIMPENKTAATRKRRAYSSRTIPEQQQIFKGLIFFFFPNNDVSPLRRLRIQRAQEFGAIWTRSWEENVTHVIVDKGLMFQDVLTFLKIDSFPPSIALVNESYPSECINFRSILSVTQTRFRVNGTPKSSEIEELPSSAGQSSTSSLPLKPSRRQGNSPTPSQLADTESGSVPVSAVIHVQQVVEYPQGTPDEEVIGESFPTRERDALDDLIDETKATKDLPLDPLESLEDEASPGASDEESSASDSEPTKSKRRKISSGEDKVTDAWQQKFACMQKHDQNSNSENPNSRTIEVLQQMLDYYTRTSDHWRVIAYRKAISALRRQPKKIVTRVQALSITGIGQRLADKIEEIVFTNRLRRLENTNCTPEDRIFQEFLGVYGAGISLASRWVAQGFRSLDDLRTKAPLTRQQRVGVERYYDFSQRIPRQEIEAHGDIVRKAVQEVDPEMQVIISGSYRRGAVNSGDVDVLITKPDTAIEQIRTMMMDIVVPQLFKQGFLQVSLASTSRGDGSKWHGASALPGSNLWRRIDLLFVPGSEIGAALIYFTGNDIFNRSMRLLASKKGLRLNQRGLYADVLRGEQRAKLNTGRLLEGHDERRIFELLGVPWRPPEHRIC